MDSSGARRERGATSVEWVGVVAVSGLLALALLGAASGWAATLTGKVGGVVCAVASVAGASECATPTAETRAAETPRRIDGASPWSPAADGGPAAGGLTARPLSKWVPVGSSAAAIGEGLGATAVDPVPVEWCALVGSQVGRDVSESVEQSICAVGDQVRLCTRTHPTQLGPTPTQTFLCDQADLDPRRLNCDDAMSCSVSDPTGRQHWMSCAISPTNASRVRCTPAFEPTDPTEPLRSCTTVRPDRQANGSLRSAGRICVNPAGIAELCPPNVLRFGGCTDRLPGAITHCGNPTRDRRAICFVDDGSNPTTCSTASGGDRICQSVRSFECTLQPDDVAVGCIERTPGARPASTVPSDGPVGTCPATGGRRALQARTVRELICGAGPLPEGDGEPVDPSPVYSGELDSVPDETYDRTSPLIPIDRRLIRVATVADDSLEAMRCAYGIRGIDGAGTAARVWMSTQAQLAGEFGDAAAQANAHSGLLIPHTPEGFAALGHELGHALVLAGGLRVFAHGADGEPWALNEGFAMSTSAFLAGQATASPRPQGSEVGPLNQRRVDYDRQHLNRSVLYYDAAEFAASHRGNVHLHGYLAVQLLRDVLRPLVRGPAAPVAGCAGAAADSLARWFGRSLQTLAQVAQADEEEPGFSEWCEAMARTGAAWGVTAEQTYRAFNSREVPCGPEGGVDEAAAMDTDAVGTPAAEPPLPKGCPVFPGPPPPPRDGIARMIVIGGPSCGIA